MISNKLDVRVWLIKLQKAVLELSGSFWFIPSVMIALAAIGAYVLPSYTPQHALSMLANNQYLVSDVQSAVNVTRVIAASTITVTSIAFSMTLVALVMASNQFGPRILKNFMQDKRTQCVLGLFTSTFVYCLLILSQINFDAANATYPLIAVLVAQCLAVVCVFVLIYFIHHVATSIRADSIVKQVAYAVMQDMQRLQKNQGDKRAAHTQFFKSESYAYAKAVKSTQSGYVQAIEYHNLVKLACTENVVIKLKSRAGKFILADEVIATVYSNKTIADSIDVNALIITGTERTPLQDPQYAINQLVEIALRALSPSLNDPFTAIICIDKLSQALSSFSEKTLPHPLVLDSDNNVRVITNEEPFEDLFAGAFNQIRQAGQQSETIICHLLDTFTAMLNASRHAQHLLIPIHNQVKCIEQMLGSGQSHSAENDKIVINRRIHSLLKEIDLKPEQ